MCASGRRSSRGAPKFGGNTVSVRYGGEISRAANGSARLVSLQVLPIAPRNLMPPRNSRSRSGRAV